LKVTVVPAVVVGVVGVIVAPLLVPPDNDVILNVEFAYGDESSYVYVVPPSITLTTNEPGVPYVPVLLLVTICDAGFKFITTPLSPCFVFDLLYPHYPYVLQSMLPMLHLHSLPLMSL
jgi:hypothetical protein